MERHGGGLEDLPGLIRASSQKAGIQAVIEHSFLPSKHNATVNRRYQPFWKDQIHPVVLIEFLDTMTGQS
jgi:hypothetical protein